MKIVYLDQNKWIELNGAYHATKTRPQLDRTLEFIRDRLRKGAITVPLSAVHYMEIARIADRTRRARLGETMWALSGGRTFASFRRVIEHEIEEALARRYPEITPEPFELLGKGFAYALGIDYVYRCPDELRSRVPDSSVETLESAVQSIMERAVLTGDGPRASMEMPPFRSTVHKERFKDHLEQLRPRISQLPSEQWDAALRVIEFGDIKDRIESVLQRQKLNAGVLTSLATEGLSAFLDELPSRRVDLHLHTQALRNQNGKFHINDLEDWSALGLASAYCDVLVCEKHFASLVQRSGFRPKAQILTELTALPELQSLR